MSQYIRLIRENPDFRLLWFAQVISLTGDWFNTVVLSARVSQFTGGSGLAISLFLMARFLPPLLISPFSGVIVDRFNRQKILVYSNLLRVGVVLMFLFTDSPDMLWLIYLLTIVQFTLSGFFEPGQSAITPGLLRREDLVIANTLASVTWSVMLALGAILGGIVASLFGSTVAILIDGVTFAVAAFLISRINYTRPADDPATDDMPATPGEKVGGFREGLRYLRNNPATASSLLIKGGSSLGNVDLLMTVFATQIFVIGQTGELSLAILYSSFGVGAILGPLLTNRVNDGSVRRMRRLVIIGFAFAAGAWFVMGAAGTLAVFAAGILIRAMGGSINWTYSQVIIQETVPDRYLGRVFALDLAFFQLATVTGTLVHGALVDVLGNAQLALIVYGTAVVSFIPLVIWIVLVGRMEQAATPALGD